MASDSQVQIQFDTSVYRLDAIKKAAYRLSADFTFDIKTIAETGVELVVHFSSEQFGAEDVFRIVKREVLDQELRESILAETASLRGLLMKHAFSESGTADESSQASPE